MSFEEPTPIQLLALPPAPAGRIRVLVATEVAPLGIDVEAFELRPNHIRLATAAGQRSGGQQARP